MEHQVLLEIPLKSETQARAIYDTIRVDPILEPSEFSRELKVENNVLKADLHGVTVRTLRLGVSLFMDHLNESLECLSEFDPQYYKRSSEQHN